MLYRRAIRWFCVSIFPWREGESTACEKVLGRLVFSLVMKKSSILMFFIVLVNCAPLLFADLPKHPLIERTREMRGRRLEYALQNHARFFLTPDKKTFYLLWLPEGSDPENPPPMVATISGHDGWAVEDFYVWHEHVSERGYGLLTIQWWLMSGEKTSDYLTPSKMHGIMTQVFQEQKVKPRSVLLHGFSRGSTQTYAMAAMEQSSYENYFALIVANAGRANASYPPTHEIEAGLYGDQPLKGTHWVTFAGGRDTNPERDGIIGMRETASWIQKFGGVVDLAIEDPEADHGGFHRRPQNVRAALDVFEKLLRKNVEAPNS